MSLLKRLGFYLIGLAIGLVFLAFFLNRKKAQFCYMPNCRVLKELRSKPLTYSEDSKQELMRQNLDSTDVLYLLNQGDVDFGASDTKADPCKVYVIEGSPKELPMQLTVENCDSLVTVLKLEKNLN